MPRFTLLPILFFLLGCAPFHHCMQTAPTCSLTPYAIIEFVNFTGEEKLTYVQRYYDNEKLEEPIVEIVPPKMVYRFRIPPGVYQFGTKFLNGEIRSWKTKRALVACEVVTVNMSWKDPPLPPEPIRSRRYKKP